MLPDVNVPSSWRNQQRRRITRFNQMVTTRNIMLDMLRPGVKASVSKVRDYLIDQHLTANILHRPGHGID